MARSARPTWGLSEADADALIRAERGRANTQQHKRFMAQVVAELREAGFAVQFVHDSRHSPKGKLDLTAKRVYEMIEPRTPAWFHREQWAAPRWLEVEIKTGKAKLSPEQGEEWERLAHFPFVERYLWRDSDDWEAIRDDIWRADYSTGNTG